MNNLLHKIAQLHNTEVQITTSSWSRGYSRFPRETSVLSFYQDDWEITITYTVNRADSPKPGWKSTVSDIPSPNILKMISDEDYDNYSGQIDADDLYMEMKIIVKCPNCQRLHVYWDGFDKPAVVYSIDK